jgi:hypothetical protein
MIDTSHTHLHLCTERHCTPLAPLVHDPQGNAGTTAPSGIAAPAAAQSPATGPVQRPHTRPSSLPGLFRLPLPTTHGWPRQGHVGGELAGFFQGTVRLPCPVRAGRAQHFCILGQPKIAVSFR